MELIKRLIPETIIYESESTGKLHLKPITLRQYLDSMELVKELKDYLQTHDRTTLLKINNLTNNIKDDIMRYNDLSPAPTIIDMNLSELMGILSHSLPVFCCSKPFSPDLPGKQLAPAYAAGKIMMIFPHYGIEELLDMSVLSFYALYELAVRMQADMALEVNYAAAAAFHNGNTTVLRHRRGSLFCKPHTPDPGIKPEEFQAVRELAEKLIKENV